MIHSKEVDMVRMGLRRSSLKAREEAAFLCANPLFSPISQKSGELEVIKKGMEQSQSEGDEDLDSILF